MPIAKMKFANLFEQKNSLTNPVCQINVNIIIDCSSNFQRQDKLQPRLSEMQQNNVGRNSLHARKVKIELIKN